MFIKLQSIERMTTLQHAPNSHDGIEKSLVEMFGQSPTEKYSLAGYFTASDFLKPINLPSQTDHTTLLNVLWGLDKQITDLAGGILCE